MIEWPASFHRELTAKGVEKAQELRDRCAKGDEAEMVHDAGRSAFLKAVQGDSDAFAEISDVRARLISLGLGADVIELDFEFLRAKAAAGADPQHAKRSTGCGRSRSN